MERREFLRHLSGAGLALGSSGWLVERLWALQEEGRLPARSGAPLESWIHTVCTQCPGGCGLRLRRYEGLPVQLAGNAHSPVNRGGLCPLGSAGLQVLYHPDRIREPLLRVGERGERQWKAVSWNEGIRILQERLQRLRRGGEPHRLAFLEAASTTTMEAVIAQFMRAYGSPNHVRRDGIAAARLAFRLAQGEDRQLAYDLPHSLFVLSFGFDLLEAEGAPVWQTSAYGRLRAGTLEQRGDFVQVEPRMSLTAAQADWWLGLRPGSEAALALGLAHVLVREGLYDRAFVRRHTFGFEDWTDSSGVSHSGFKTLVLRNYTPETVSHLSGVATEDIFRLARAFGAHDTALALAGKGSDAHTNGVYTQLAVQALNALVGAIERPGGLLQARPAPLRPLAEFEPDAVAQEGRRQPALGVDPARPLAGAGGETLLERLEEGTPYVPDTLLVYGANPAFEIPDTERVKRALGQIPFVVSFASFMDETALQADLILPDHTYLERWGDVSSIPGIGWAHAALQQPVMPPLYQTRHTGDVLIQVARALGDATARAFPERDFSGLLRRRFRGLFESGRGEVVGAAGPLPAPASFEAFWEQLLERGMWRESLEYGKTPLFTTPSGKYEFYLQALRESAAGEEDTAFLPHLNPPRFSGDPLKFPYYLCVFDTNTLFGGRGALLPLMMEMVGLRRDITWDGWVEINPAAARQLEINEGDEVFLESEVGRVRARVKLWPGVPPDMVALPAGLGHEAFGRYARGRGANPNLLLARMKDELSGAGARLATRVRIIKTT